MWPAGRNDVTVSTAQRRYETDVYDNDTGTIDKQIIRLINNWKKNSARAYYFFFIVVLVVVVVFNDFAVLLRQKIRVRRESFESSVADAASLDWR